MSQKVLGGKDRLRNILLHGEAVQRDRLNCASRGGRALGLGGIKLLTCGDQKVKAGRKVRVYGLM